MAAPPPTRGGVDTAGLPDFSHPDHMPYWVNILPEPTLREILQSAALTHPDVASDVLLETARFIESQQSTTVYFDHLSHAVWTALNVTYGELTSVHQYALTEEAVRSVTRSIEAVRTGCGVTGSYETKVNAVESLRRIGMVICTNRSDVLSREIIKAFKSDTILEETMLAIVQGMTHDERGKLLKDAWLMKLWQLIVLSADHHMMDGLGDVLASIVR